MANCLEEIREKTDYTEWRWVPSKHNPADDATRFFPEAIGPDSRWFSGPNFLLPDESQWPQLAGVCQEPPLIPEYLIESQESKVFCTTLQDVLVDFWSCFTLDRLIRHVALLIKFISRCQKFSLSKSELHSKAELHCIQQS